MTHQNISVLIIASAMVLFTFLIQWVRARRISTFHESLREAIRQGSPKVDDMLAQLDRPPSIGFGAIGPVLIAVGFALPLFGLIDGDLNREMVGIGMFPLLVGAVLTWQARRRPVE